MPIVTIQCVKVGSASNYSEETVQLLADLLGDIFESEPGNTWVRMSTISQSSYAENREPLKPGVEPTFVEVLKRYLPDEGLLAIESKAITRCVAETLGRPPENVHVIYLPQGAGRVAFGGNLTLL